VHAASEILYNLSPDYKDLDPCEDFEELVCSGWRDRHDLRPDQGDAFTGTIMAESSQLLLRHILEGPSPDDLAEENSDDRDNFKKLQAAYSSCLDEDSIKKAGLQPILDFLDEVNLKLSRTTSRDGLVGNATLLLSKYGIDPFVAAGVGADDRDPDVVVVSISPPWSFGLPSKERYEDSKLLEKYRGIVAEVFGKIYPEQDKKVIGKVVDLEKRLAAASPSVEEREDVTVSCTLFCAHSSFAHMQGPRKPTTL
jgi:endothelin-converting enzyme